MQITTDEEQAAKVKAWEEQGYVFIGNGSENNEDDPNLCPCCDSDDLFWALWEHKEKRRYIETDSEYNPFLLNSTNICMECGRRWVDEEEQQQTDPDMIRRVDRG